MKYGVNSRRKFWKKETQYGILDIIQFLFEAKASLRSTFTLQSVISIGELRM